MCRNRDLTPLTANVVSDKLIFIQRDGFNKWPSNSFGKIALQNAEDFIISVIAQNKAQYDF